jgi:catechol 2,3-dioxygenase-like lactoylglutathione lyase family enzyme
MIESVLPTALTVSDMDRALGFYRDLLGFELAVELPPKDERERWDAYHERVCGITGSRIDVAYLQATDGATHLELIEYLRPKLEPAPPRSLAEPGVSIVALRVRNSAAVVERLRAAGVDVLSDPVRYRTDAGEESYTTYLYDPDGNALCLFETLEPH